MLHRRRVTQCETKSLSAGYFPDAYVGHAAFSEKAKLASQEKGQFRDMARVRFGCQQSKARKDVSVVLAKLPRWRPGPYIRAAGHSMHLQLCVVHGWAMSLNGIESPSPYHVGSVALGKLLVLAASAIKSAMKRRRDNAAAAFGNMLANSRTHRRNVRVTIVARSKSQNRTNNEKLQ